VIVDKKPKHSSVTVMCVLAYLDRYVYPVLILLAGLLAELFRDRNTMLCVLALGILLDGIYNLVGYLCRWKHIYLCYQSMSHTKMTPTRIEWERLAKKDAYGVPATLIIGGEYFSQVVGINTEYVKKVVEKSDKCAIINVSAYMDLYHK
jgi:hypothetical protein